MVQAVSADSHVEQSFQDVQGIIPWQYVGVCGIRVSGCNTSRLSVAAFDVSHISRRLCVVVGCCAVGVFLQCMVYGLVRDQLSWTDSERM